MFARPDDRMPDAQTVAPGLHSFDGYEVVWCDPRWLEPLGLKPTTGVRRQELIVKDVAADIVAEGRSAYERWRAAHDAAIAQGSTPSLVVETVRHRAGDRPSVQTLPVNVGDVSVVDLRSSTKSSGRSNVTTRPGGPTFGLLVHTLLADVPLDASREIVLRAASAHGRAFGASDEDALAAADVTMHVLTHELFSRAREASARGACRREVPVSLLAADGALIEGVVDLAFEQNGQWVVVDYKTDWEIASADERRYRSQIALYVSAIAQATGQTATGFLVRV